MKTGAFLVTAVLAILLPGCATSPQAPVPLVLSESVPKNARIAVASTAMPKVNTFFPGANFLLCLAFAEASNGSLTRHTQQLPHEDLPQLKEKIAALLREKGGEVIVANEPLDISKLPKNSKKAENAAPHDFTTLAKKYDVQKLVVVEIQMLGMVRDYSAYIPTSAPRAVMVGHGYMVNLSDNRYEWFAPVNVARSAEGNWDEAPRFPGLSNAYFQVIEAGKEAYLEPFRK